LPAPAGAGCWAWAWALAQLAWVDFQDWPGGHSWQAADGTYLAIDGYELEIVAPTLT